MIKFKTLSLRNFLSYGNTVTTINLNQQGTILVVGENGVGKTTWLNALTYVLYDEPVSKISKDNLINNVNKKNLEVIVEFEKDQHTYVVRRARKFKTATGNFVELFEDGKEITLDSAAHTNAKILEILNIPFELFIRIIAFPATLTPFLDLPARNQMDIIEELFDLKLLSEKAERLKDLIRETDVQFQLEELKIAQLRTEHERHKNQLTTAFARITDWQVENEARKDDLKRQLTEVKKINVQKEKKLYQDIEAIKETLNEIKGKITLFESEQQKIEQLKKAQLAHKSQLVTARLRVTNWTQETKSDITFIQKELEKLSAVDIEKEKELYEKVAALTEVLDKTKLEVIELQSKLAGLHDTIRTKDMERTLLQDNKCPYCSQSFPGASKKLHDVSTEIKLLGEGFEEITASITKFENVVKQETKKQNSLKEEITTNDIDALRRLEQERLNFSQQLKVLRVAKNPHEESLNELERSTFDVTLEELEQEETQVLGEISDLSNRLLEETEKQNAFKKELKVSSFDELIELSEKQALLLQEIKTAEQAENPFIIPYEELERTKIEEPNSDVINKLNVNLEHQRFLYKLLTKKDSFVRKGLLDRNLTYLNKRLMVYLHEMEFNFTVEFTHDMAARISKRGRELDFGNLSGGQKARVNLALSFAFRDVLQSLHDNTNICILDETLDYGLDTKGVPIAAMMIKHKAKEEAITLFITSHRDEIKGIFDKTMTISLEDEFSIIQTI